VQTPAKLAALQLMGGIFGWLWILGSIAAVGFLLVSITGGGMWVPFIWSVALSVAGRALARRFYAARKRLHVANPSGHLTSRGGEDLRAVQTLVNRYGGVLETCRDMLCSEEQLPASKPAIKAALIAAARASLAASPGNPGAIEPLRVGYASLANFVAPEHARISSAFDQATRLAEREPERIQDVAAALVDSKALEIQQRSNDEFRQLIKEFDAAVLS